MKRAIFLLNLTLGVVLLFAVAHAQEMPTMPAPTEQGSSQKEQGDQNIETFGPGMEEGKPNDVVQEEGSTKGTVEGATPGPQVYTINLGDNLWDICSRFLGNPFEWPKLWAINQYITNPHLIYPGSTIVFKPGSETSLPKMEIAAQEAPKTQASSDELPQVEETPKVSPKKRDIPQIDEETKEYEISLKTISFISPKELSKSGVITHSGEAKSLLSIGDKVYMKFKDPKNISINDKFTVFETVKKVKHPNSGKLLGYQTLKKGVVKVVAIDKYVVTALIVDADLYIQRDERVIPYTDTLVRVKPIDLDKEINGYIVGSEREHRLIGQNEFAYIDRGLKQGVENGALFYVVRRGDELLSPKDKKLPYVVVGKLLVVDVKDNTSTVYIITSNKDLEVGDVIKAKL